MIIGSHVRMVASEYLEGSVKEALSYGADALMVYTGAPQNTKRVPIEKLHIKEATFLMDKHGISKDHLIIHAPYLINLANPEKADFAAEFLLSEIRRTENIGAKNIVVHPGSFTNRTVEDGIASIVRHLNSLSSQMNDSVICLETMAGKGTEIGRNFEEIAEIFSKLNDRNHFAVCMDTCHIHDAGYDLSNFDDVLNQFDALVGLKYLNVIHLNDSKNPRGSHKDRHANIGDGFIGFDVLSYIANCDRIQSIPKILETPYIDGNPPYKDEIKKLKNSENQ